MTGDDFAIFTAHENGAVRGRITAHVHRASNTRFGLKRGYFGYFDCADDERVAAVLTRIVIQDREMTVFDWAM